MNALNGTRLVLPCVVTLQGEAQMIYPVSLLGDELFDRFAQEVSALSKWIGDANHGLDWTAYALSSGGVFMAPMRDDLVELNDPDGMRLRLSAEAFGIACCLLSLKLSLGHRPKAAKVISEQVAHLELFATGRRDCLSIMSAVRMLRRLKGCGSSASSSCPTAPEHLRTAVMPA